jgi:deoxycytidine triphosphate deaminase
MKSPSEHEDIAALPPKGRGTVLTSVEIAAQVARGQIEWPGELRGDSLLLNLGSPIQPLISLQPARVVDLGDQASIDALYEPPQHSWRSFNLAPGQMALCLSEFPLRLGGGLAGVMGTLSHLARLGLAVHVASPWVMPGWNGYLTFELLNAGPAALRLHRGMPVGRLVIIRTDGAARPVFHHPQYGSNSQLGSRYADEFASHAAWR